MFPKITPRQSKNRLNVGLALALKKLVDKFNLSP